MIDGEDEGGRELVGFSLKMRIHDEARQGEFPIEKLHLIEDEEDRHRLRMKMTPPEDEVHPPEGD